MAEPEVEVVVAGELYADAHPAQFHMDNYGGAPLWKSCARNWKRNGSWSRANERASCIAPWDSC